MNMLSKMDSPTNTEKHDQGERASAVERQLRLAIWAHAILDLAVKWLGGCLIGKLLSTTESNEDAISSLSPFYRIILLDKLAFAVVATMGVVMSVLTRLVVSKEKALAVQLGTLKGRLLRRKVLIRATEGANVPSSDPSHQNEGKTQNTSVPSDGDWATVASELVRRVSMVETFFQNEEPLIRYCWLKLALSVLCIFFVLWKAGLITIVLLIVGEGLKYVVEARRLPFHEQVEENRRKVHARLLDTIKNATMIFATRMAEWEANSLRNLEISSDDTRKKDGFWRFVRELTMLPVALGPIAIPVAVYLELSGTDDPVRAFELGTAVLIVLLVGDEGHKSLLQLSLMFDRELAAKEASEALDMYLGEDQKDNVDESMKKTSHSTTSESLNSDEEVPPEPALSPSPTNHRIGLEQTQEIALKNITLFYPGRKDPALNQVTVSFQKGQIHGLVGESGSGKSTTMKLVAGLTSPTDGVISHWRGMKVAYVSQEQSLFARTIRENVTYGVQTTRTDPEIWKALEMAEIASFVHGLPNGLDEELTEGENMVSGGQLQRLHLAHLFCVWHSADLVLLDECLSALDETTRHVMIDRLQEFLKGKTALVITHHSEMLRMCDNVHDITPRNDP